MKPYELTEPARSDLFDIWNHIAQDSLDTANRVMDDLERAMERLAEYPQLGHRRTDVHDLRYRFWTVYSYVIVYAPDTSPLQISRVIHGHRNVPAVLGE